MTQLHTRYVTLGKSDSQSLSFHICKVIKISIFHTELLHELNKIIYYLAQCPTNYKCIINCSHLLLIPGNTCSTDNTSNLEHISF